jgi:AraC family transcriptional regulator
MFNPASQVESMVFSGLREKQSHPAIGPQSSAPCYGGLAPCQLMQVKKLIEKNLFENIRIKTLANLAGLSESYFYSAFRRSTGQTPHAFITQRRIEHAQTLMILTDLPLSRIACECGLTDQPHLTRLFRRQLGTSPALWRKWRRAASKTFQTPAVALPG